MSTANWLRRQGDELIGAGPRQPSSPDALQVADRLHLVHNLADALERFAVRVLAAVRKELKVITPFPLPRLGWRTAKLFTF
jgi:hypothetical protein